MYMRFLILASTITTVMGFLDSLYLQLDSNCNGTESFICRNSRCILKNQRCDGKNDCFDSSDEENCDEYHCKEPDFFRCKNSICISSSFVCDDQNDCLDYSDEENCESFQLNILHATNCSQKEWQCSDKLCIPESFVCNGEPDCLDGSDETLGCSAKIPCEGFKCKNGHCIPHEWRCDGGNDCQDNSDEQDCASYLDPKDCLLDDRRFLCTSNNTCLKLSQVCNDKKECPDGSDESPFCTLNTCKDRGCSHECVKLPNGPKCICPKGYHTISDKTCVDVNECEIYGVCDQKCRNTPGSYECYCDAKYILQEDKSTCRVAGGEAMMIFSSKTEIRGYFLQSGLYFPIAKNLKQVFGVAFDGHHLYWTDIFSEHKSIVKALEDGSNRELLVTFGLGAPEDLAVDWITGNIYFTDSEMQHIGVCNDDGSHCTVLVNEDVHKPRGIVLNPSDGEMFWSDWGKRPEIARSKMDGTEDKSFVSNNIEWPNGLTVDYPNQRLYWADAKFMTLESIRLDGTDRRVILEGVVKHPYAIAVFENRLFWSDLTTNSIQSCDKFTGKNHHTLIKDKREYIYGIHIFHSALKTKKDNPCLMAFCSDLCLLSGSDYSCACPQDKILQADKHTCKLSGKRQLLVAGTKDMLIRIEHQLLGKHEVMALPTVAKNIGALAYSSINNTLFISDTDSHSIITMHMVTGHSKQLYQVESTSRIESISYDYFGNNLYWCDLGMETVNILNLNTMSQRILLHDMLGEIPTSIVVVPEEGIMFISFRRKSELGYHIDRFRMDGTGRTHVIELGLLGPITLYYEFSLHRIFWSDAGTGNIESTSIEGDDRHGFRSLRSNPVGLASLSKDIFWTNQRSSKIYWADKNNGGYNRKITLDLPEDIDGMRIISISPRPIPSHPCRQNNGNCTHLCLAVEKSAQCACPLGMNLKVDNVTCFKPKTCAATEFFCKNSETCISRDMLCNGHKDCLMGEDEVDCDVHNDCLHNEFQCKNGECIKNKFVCDMHYDCKDKTDEMVCSDDKYKRKCPENHFRCSNDLCIAERFVCDGVKDCYDGDDELINCVSTTCSTEQFRCTIGSCIPKSWECDHEYDCSDLSDEHSGCGSITCSPEKFTCNNGRCIDKILQCDKVDDCGDMSDEISCKISDRNGCKLNEFQCRGNKTICIPESALCNGTPECPLHDDEQGCSNCRPDEFECDNKICLTKDWICDGTDDCGDGSDESLNICAYKNHSLLVPSADVPCPHGFRCKSGQCINIRLLCNGEENCFDGSDEHGACNTSCQVNSNPCSHKCIKTPSGPMCACETGYKLRGDGQTCVDIKECSFEPPICSQLCTEQLGSYTCGCFNGYVLRADKISCKSKGEPMSMVFTVNNEIRQLSKANNTLSILYSDDSPSISGLDISIELGYIYFSIEQTSTIHRINLKNFSREYLTNVGKPQKLAVDWITQNIYFVDGSDKTIRVCNFHQQLCSKLFSLDSNSQISAITVDAVNKHIFYSVTSWWIFNSPNSVIYKCNLDGSRLQELLKSTKGYITGLAYDIYRKKIFYVDKHNGQINQINYDGNNQMNLIYNLSKPYGLNFFEDNLYYLMNGGLMGKCKLFGDERSCEAFRLNTQSGELFSILQSSRQPNVGNVCQNNNCTQMCIPTDVRPKCLCFEGNYVLEGQECKLERREAHLPDKKPLFKPHVTNQKSSIENSSAGSMVAGVLIPIFILLGAAVVYLFIRRRNSGKFNISMRFYNPMFGISSNNEAPGTVLQVGEHEYSNPVDFCSQDMNAATNAILQKVNPLVNIDG